MGKGDQSGGRHTSCGSDHVGLLDAAVEGALRVFFGKRHGSNGVHQISVQNDDSWVMLCQLHQSLCVNISHGLFLRFMFLCDDDAHNTASFAFFSSFNCFSRAWILSSKNWMPSSTCSVVKVMW